jgi:hypothetical protein
VDSLDRVAPSCEVVTREISRDVYRNPESRHQTEVEPDTAAAGSTVVAAFQVGRIFDGGAANIGFAVSRNRGRSWQRGLLPGLTPFSRPAGSWARASDPTVAYDARHHAWLVASLLFGSEGSALGVSRSLDGVHWSRPLIARLAPSSRGETLLDKPWIGCDNWVSSPFRGHCYLSYSDLVSAQIVTQVSTSGGLSWAPPVSGPGLPGHGSVVGAYAPGVQIAVRPDGRVVIPYFDETQLSQVSSTDGGASWSAATPVAPARYVDHRGFRAAPLPSAAVDRAGTIYVAWADCSARPGCAANDIVVTHSTDGTSWSAPARVPTGAPDAELPGLAADPGAAGRLALAYYVLRGGTRLDVGFVSSARGGARWTRPQRLDSRSFPLSWIAPTSQGAMVGDYISTSFAGGRAVPVFALATKPRGSDLREAMFATSLAVGH